jgi:hypothetical protein
MRGGSTALPFFPLTFNLLTVVVAALEDVDRVGVQEYPPASSRGFCSLVR